MRPTFVLALVVGIALGILGGARRGRAQSGGGGPSDVCIGLSATCSAFRASPGAAPVPRWCERRAPAPAAWPDADVTVDRLDVTPPEATADVRADVVGEDGRVKGLVRECYREALAARSTVAGLVTIRLTFDKGSKCLHRVTIAGNGTGDAHLARCAADALYGLFTVKPAAAAPVTARLTLRFRRAR